MPTPWLRPTACGRGFVCWATTCSPAAAEPARNSKPGVYMHVCFTYYLILLRHFIIHVFAIFSARMEQRTYLLESSHLYSVIDLRQVSCCVDYVFAPVICHLETSQYVRVCFFVDSRGPIRNVPDDTVAVRLQPRVPLRPVHSARLHLSDMPL